MKETQQLVREGYGTSELHVGMTAEEAVSALKSRPDREQIAEGTGVYLIYKRKGVEILVSGRTGKVMSLFFKSPHANVRLSSGIGLRSRMEAVLDAYGPPQNRGGGHPLSTGKYVGTWFSYNMGLGFHFNKGGLVTTISIFQLN